MSGAAGAAVVGAPGVVDSAPGTAVVGVTAPGVGASTRSTPQVVLAYARTSSTAFVAATAWSRSRSAVVGSLRSEVATAFTRSAMVCHWSSMARGAMFASCW